jgi:copper chaperone CopZ
MLKELLGIHRGRTAGPLETARINVKGMNSRKCEQTVKKALLTKNGVREVYLSRDNGVAVVVFDAGQTDIPTLHQVILRKGYIPSAPEG